MKKRHEQKLIILSVMLLMAFNMPLLLIFDQSDSFAGIPVIYFYIFSIWALVILVSFFIMKKYYE